MNNMEIKQGDMVRVSKDAPKVYQKGSIFDYAEHQSNVHEIDGDAAIIGLDIEDSPIYSAPIAIPTKYLVKVDAEAKEAKYRKDDKVCINKSSLKHGLRGEILTIIGADVSDRTYYVQSRCMRSPIWLREDEISPYVEPTEQTEVEKSFEDQLRDVLNGVEHQDYGHPIQAAMISLDINYWDAYAAELAKEVVLKTVNSASDRRPSAIAEYAVSVAKAVVEGLKRK